MLKLICTALLILAAAIVAINGSSHSEAPGTAQTPQTDITDLYAFRSYETGRDAFVTIVMNVNPRQTGYGGPNYFALDDKFYYEINVDNNGDGEADIIYRFDPHNELANSPTGIALNVGGAINPVALKFVGPISAGDNSNLNFLEFYRLHVVQGGVTQDATTAAGATDFVKPFDYAGNKTFADYNAYANQYIYDVNLPGCGTQGRVFVGQRAESFSINIGKIFDLVNFVPLDASAFTGGIAQDANNNVIAGSNIDSFVLEVPTSCIIGAGNGVIGVWGTSRSKRTDRQKSRLGNPLVNELFIGLKDKDRFNKRTPNQDGLLQGYIQYPTFPAILDLLFRDAINGALGTSYSTIAPINFPRADLVAVFLTGVPGLNQLLNGVQVEYLRLNTSYPVTDAATQSSLGVIGGDAAGFPNGRRLGDDVIDIALRAAMGVLCHAGLGVCDPSQAVVGDKPFTDGAPIAATNFSLAFPYLNLPKSGSSYTGYYGN